MRFDPYRNGLGDSLLGIVDAQSVKNTDTADEKSDDPGKKVQGNRHIVVDTNDRIPV